MFLKWAKTESAFTHKPVLIYHRLQGYFQILLNHIPKPIEECLCSKPRRKTVYKMEKLRIRTLELEYLTSNTGSDSYSMITTLSKLN